ncbi:MAG TPA: hypothetical protein VK797_17150 [Tepidisphaeraceae bacterium]|nr:hypothetical protein [Tepidisphaeraceae bacterium]
MNDWEKPEAWEKIGEMIGHLLTALAVFSAALSNMKKKFRPGKRNKKKKPTPEQLVKRIEELEKDTQKAIDLIAEGFAGYNKVLTLLMEQGLRPFFDEHFKWRKSMMNFTTASGHYTETTKEAFMNLLNRVTALEAAVAAKTPAEPRRRIARKRLLEGNSLHTYGHEHRHRNCWVVESQTFRKAAVAAFLRWCRSGNGAMVCRAGPGSATVAQNRYKTDAILKHF